MAESRVWDTRHLYESFRPQVSRGVNAHRELGECFKVGSFR
jgi:hypothetical protein